MKKGILLLLCSALLLPVLCGCAATPSSSSEVSGTNSTPASTAVDMSADIRAKASDFADAVKTKNVVMMETLGNVPVDTYGEWSKPQISDVRLDEVSVAGVSGLFTLTVIVTDAGGSAAVENGENVFSLSILWDDAEGEFVFAFVRA